jgi:CRP/FNR family transcriptional regulator, anaerobic regulatory protein
MDIKQYIKEKIVGNSLELKMDILPFPTYRKTIKKNEIISQFGQIERKAYLLISGIIESSISKDGEVKIIDFVFPNSFICSYTSFLLQTPSEIQTKAIADCEVEYFLKEDLEKAYKKSIVANQFGRYVTEQFFISKLKRENDFLTKTAKEVYLNLMQERPEILEKIPINKIAKYLGIHPESLSRIRAEIIS